MKPYTTAHVGGLYHIRCRACGTWINSTAHLQKIEPIYAAHQCPAQH